MKRLRLLFLVLALFAVVLAFYYQHVNTVRVETVWLQSKVTGRQLPYNVVLPPGYGSLSPWRMRYPVLYLLHGHGGAYSSWVSQTGLAKYVSELKMIVVTPEGDEGWYTDSATIESNKYETFIMKELLPDVESRFRIIPGRSARAIAGNSMGGYGALKFGLKYPDMFTFAGSMSGAFDAPLRTHDPSILQAFGPPSDPTREANNLTRLAVGVAQERISALPYMHLDCGEDDPWLVANRELASVFVSRGIKHDYQELSGAHDWAYWDHHLREVLRVAVATMTPAQR